MPIRLETFAGVCCIKEVSLYKRNQLVQKRSVGTKEVSWYKRGQLVQKRSVGKVGRPEHTKVVSWSQFNSTPWTVQ